MAYNAGEPWWLTDDPIIRAATAEQEDRFTTDSWEEQIQAALDSWNPLHPITTATVMAAIGLETARQGRAEQMRTAACLMRLGYVRKRTRVAGRLLYVWTRRDAGDAFEK